MKTAPRVGDRVLVPFGYGEVEAEVVHVSDIFTPPKVEVEFRIEEDDEEPMRAMYSVTRIHPAPVPSA